MRLKRSYWGLCFREGGSEKLKSVCELFLQLITMELINQIHHIFPKEIPTKSVNHRLIYDKMKIKESKAYIKYRIINTNGEVDNFSSPRFQIFYYKESDEYKGSVRYELGFASRYYDCKVLQKYLVDILYIVEACRRCSKIKGELRSTASLWKK